MSQTIAKVTKCKSVSSDIGNKNTICKFVSSDIGNGVQDSLAKTIVSVTTEDDKISIATNICISLLNVLVWCDQQEFEGRCALLKFWEQEWRNGRKVVKDPLKKHNEEVVILENAGNCEENDNTEDGELDIISDILLKVLNFCWS